jgi:hypothetical protein
MNSKILLRIAVVVIFIQLLGHSVGHFIWDKREDPKMMEVVASMKNYSAPFMGATKSMADYYNGYSFVIFGLYGMTIVILWFASDFISKHKEIAKQLLIPIGIAYLFFGVIEFIFFFPFAASLGLLAGMLTLLSVTVATR